MRWMHPVADPGGGELPGVAVVRIDRGVEEVPEGRDAFLGRTPPHPTVLPVEEVLQPYLPQSLHCWNLLQPGGRASRVDGGIQQIVSVGTYPLAMLYAGFLALGQLLVVEPSHSTSAPTRARTCLRSHSGAAVEKRTSRARRMVSPTNSSRFRPRTAARIRVESVRCLPLSFTRPISRNLFSRWSNSSFSASPSSRRVRNSHKIEASKPGSLSSKERSDVFNR